MTNNNVRGYIAWAYKSVSGVDLFTEKERYQDRLESYELNSCRLAQHRWSDDVIIPDEEIRQAKVEALRTEWYDGN